MVRVAAIAADIKTWRLDGAAIVFPKLGKLRAVLHRPLEGTPKTSRRRPVVREHRVRARGRRPSSATRAPAVGLDRGVAKLVADSQGKMIEYPRWRAKQERRLRRAQRAAAHKEPSLARLYRTVRRQRDWKLHQIANHYVSVERQRGEMVTIVVADTHYKAASKQCPTHDDKVCTVAIDRRPTKAAKAPTSSRPILDDNTR